MRRKNLAARFVVTIAVYVAIFCIPPTDPTTLIYVLVKGACATFACVTMSAVVVQGKGTTRIIATVLILPPLLILLHIARIALPMSSVPRNPNKWMVIQKPDKKDFERYHDFFRKANFSDIEWSVSTGEDGFICATLRGAATNTLPRLGFSPHVTDGKPLFAKSFTWLQVGDGWLVAYNEGEFGAALYWFSQDGKQNYRISRHQINQFLVDAGTIYAVEGLAHMGLSSGSMITVVKKDSRWSAETFLELPNSGEAIVAVGPGDFVVLTSDMLLRIRKDKTMRVLISEGDWGSLYPSSMAIEGDRLVYIGMRQFVGRYDLEKGGQQFVFLLPHWSMLDAKRKEITQ
jgi:hypothetical protein